jgi:hypothetical protein
VKFKCTTENVLRKAGNIRRLNFRFLSENLVVSTTENEGWKCNEIEV